MDEQTARDTLVEIVAAATGYGRLHSEIAVDAILAAPDTLTAALGLTTERWLHRIDGEYFDDDRGYTLIPEGDFYEEMAEGADEGAIEIVALVTLGPWRAAGSAEEPEA